MAALSTNKLTQEKCQRLITFCCTGGKLKMYLLSFSRSKDEWLVEQEGDFALKASVGVDPFLPPTTGWLFQNWERENFEEDPSLICTLPSTSPPCCLTVTLSGAAKEAHGDCEGEYKSIGLISAGKQVMSTISRIFLF